MTFQPAVVSVIACALAVGVLAVSNTLRAQGAKPEYLPYAEFSPEDADEQVALKHAYNQAVQSYNRALYDYLVTLERHDRLVDRHNRSPDRAERRQLRAEARPIRQRLGELRRAVTAGAAAVDQAARRAAAAGIAVR